MKCDNEYEEIDLSPINRRCCSSKDVQANYNEDYANALLESSNKCKLGNLCKLNLKFLFPRKIVSCQKI